MGQSKIKKETNVNPEVFTVQMFYLFTFVRCQGPHNMTILKGQNGPLLLFSQKVSNILLFWKYVGSTIFFETRVCHEIWVPKTRVFWKNVLRKILKIFYGTWVHGTRVPLKFFKIFSWYYHGKLNFATLKYLKSGRSLYIFETMVDCNIICKNVLFGYFCPEIWIHSL